MIDVQPADGQVIWFRMLYINRPASGIYSAASATVTLAGLPPIPWWLITMWKPT